MAMADQRGGEDIDEKIPKVGGGGGQTIDADKDDQEKDSSGGDVIMADQRGTGEVGEDLKFSDDGETIGGEVQGWRRPRGAGVKLDDITSQSASTDLPRFGDWDDGPMDAQSYTHIFNKVREERGHDRHNLATCKDEENLDFGRDTNRLDYFKTTPFNVHGDDNLDGIASYGGGKTRQLAVGNNDRRGGGKVVVGRLEQKTAITVVAPGASEKSMMGGEKEGVQRRRWWNKCWL